MKSALQIILRTAIILVAAAVVSFAGQTLIHSTFGQSLTGMPSGFQGFPQGGAPTGEQAEGQSSDSSQQATGQSAGAANASTGQASTQGMQRSGHGGRGGGNAILELGKNLAIVLIITAIGGLITTVAQRFLRRRGKPALAGAEE